MGTLKQQDLEATEKVLTGSDKISIRAAVLGDEFSWVFTLKDGISVPTEFLVKVKLLKNLLKDSRGSERVSWRFILTDKDPSITQQLKLKDMCEDVEFSYKIASKEVE